MNYNLKSILQRKEQLTGKSHKIYRRFLLFCFRIVFMTVLLSIFVGFFCFAGVLQGLIDTSPSIKALDMVPDGYSSTIYDNNGEIVHTLVGQDANREYVKLDQIPTDVKNAFIAIEDERFWNHQGIDPKGIVRAALSGLSGGTFSQGASTITQQLLKNQVFGGGSETSFVAKLKRKVQEQYLAVKLEKEIDKNQILEYYLNSINLGQNTLGVQAASKRYFDKDISELTLSEAAVIAGITQNPSAYNPISHPEANRSKREIVLTYMKNQGYITTLNYEEALADDVYARIELVNRKKTQSRDTHNSYFTDALIEEVLHDLKKHLGYTETQAYNALYRGGLSIYSTQDVKMQEVCDQILNDPANYPKDSCYQLSYQLTIEHKDGTKTNYNESSVRSFFSKKGKDFSIYYIDTQKAKPYLTQFKKAKLEKGDTVDGENINFIIQPQTSFVLMDQNTGDIKALCGGRGDKIGSRTYNRATDSLRQPGSTFKVLAAFLPALDTSGMTLATVYDDSKFNYPGTKRQVKNWYKNYRGLSSIRQGIYHSMNVVAVKAMNDVSAKTSFDYLVNLGFTSLVETMTDKNGKTYSDICLPMALGGLTKGVSNLELTNAFATIANAGKYNKSRFYTKIVDHNGNILLDHTDEGKQVMEESTAWLLTSAMEDVVKIGSGSKVKFDNLQMPVAGKTGTTTGSKDLWFVGYTPYLTAGIWGGYDQNKVQDSTSYHKKLWKTIMEKLNADYPIKDFTRPATVTTANVCSKCGKLAVEGLCDVAVGGNCIVKEYFDTSNVPEENCDCHIKCKICTLTNRLAGEKCPDNKIITKVYLQKKEISVTSDNPLIIPEHLSGKTCGSHS